MDIDESRFSFPDISIILSYLCQSDPTKAHPPHYLHELPLEDEERIESIFKDLDLDGNGKIDIHDLSATLKGAGVNQMYAKKFLESSDQNQSGDVSLKEFIHYVREHEKNLRLVFSNFDKNKDGKLDSEELVKAFKDLGIEIDQHEAIKLVQRMDRDGSLTITFNEWRDFLLYAPSDIRELIKYWRHSSAKLNAEVLIYPWCGANLAADERDNLVCIAREVLIT